MIFMNTNGGKIQDRAFSWLSCDFGIELFLSFKIGKNLPSLHSLAYVAISCLLTNDCSRCLWHQAHCSFNCLCVAWILWDNQWTFFISKEFFVGFAQYKRGFRQGCVFPVNKFDVRLSQTNSGSLSTLDFRVHFSEIWQLRPSPWFSSLRNEKRN